MVFTAVLDSFLCDTEFWYEENLDFSTLLVMTNGKMVCQLLN